MLLLANTALKTVRAADFIVESFNKESFLINAEDGHDIPVILTKNNNQHLLIMSHGITAEKTETGIYLDFSKNIFESFDSLMFDFRGHGDSPISFSTISIEGAILDLKAILDWSQNQNYQTISYLGSSFGASIVLLVSSSYDLTFLSSAVFWNPVMDYKMLSSEVKKELPPKMIQEITRLNPQDSRWPNIPLLIVHGTNDIVVPIEQSKTYVEINQPYARLFPVDNVDHGFDHKIKEVMSVTNDWLLHYI